VTALIIGAALAVAALVYVLLPLFDAIAPARARTGGLVALAPESAIDALREIEFDRATGKLSDADYSALKAEYTRKGLVEMRARRGALSTHAPAATVGASVEATTQAPNEATGPAALDIAEAAILRYRSIRRECDTCGPRPEPDPAFCSTCGKYLKGACAHCGAVVDAPASKFCAHCGNTLAA
jgi:rRNA maturation endonuclease Nob1